MSLKKIGKKLLKDKDFFLSEEVKNYFTQLAHRITGKKIQVNIDWNGGTGATDGKTIHASANNPFAENMSRKNKFSVLVGLVMHEIGHILYSDFSILRKMINHMQDEGKFYPAPTIQYDLSLVEIIGRMQCIHLLKGIWNSVEDGHVECRLMEEYSSYKPEVAAMRWSQYEMTKSLEDDQQSGLDKYSLIANRILTYAEFCDVKAQSDNELLVQYVNPLLPMIKKAVLCKNAFLRASYSVDIFVQLLDTIVEDLKNQSQQQQSSANNSQGQNSEESKEQSESGSDSSSQNSSNEEQGNEETQSGNSGGSDSEEKNNSSESNSQSGSNEKEQEEQSSEAGNGSSNEQSQQESGSGSNSNEENNSSESGSQGGASGTENTSQENASGNGSLSEDQKESLRQAIQQICDNMEEKSDCDESMNTKPIKDDIGNVDESNTELPSEPDEQKSHDFSYLEQKAEEQTAKNDRESKINREIKDFPSSIDFDNMHNKISCIVRRKELDTNDRYYHKLEKEVSPMVRHIVSELKKEIKQRQQGDKLSGLYVGRRLEGRNLYRQDKRVMSKNRLPEDIPDMRVCYLGDCSGSMYGDGKIEKSRKMALAVYTACKHLDIPVAVYGHTDRKNGTVNMFAYAEFDSVDDKDKFRIANMDSYDCNRDGYALKFCVERLARYPEAVKLLFVTSDGLPNGSYGYGSEAGMIDIQRVLKECKKKNIVVVTAGLGEDKPNIERIWQPNGKKSCKFLDLSDEEMLPKKLVRIITNYLS